MENSWNYYHANGEKELVYRPFNPNFPWIFSPAKSNTIKTLKAEGEERERNGMMTKAGSIFALEKKNFHLCM